MDDRFDAEEMRRPALQTVLLAAIVMMIGSGILFLGRPVMLSNSPRIDYIADVPVAADRARLINYIDAYPYFVPQRASFLTRFAAATGGMAQDTPMLGYSVREVSILGLPLVGYTELGNVVAVADLSGVRATPISDEQLTELDRHAGSKLESGWVFPFWQHSWGWLALVATALVVWLELRFQADRRHALGVI